MRLDRSITLSLIYPLRRAAGLAHRALRTPHSALRIPPVPVLMYHSISDETESSVSPYYQLNTVPAVFRDHMRLLADRGCQTLTMSGLCQAMAGSTLTSSRAVCITFDDGFRNFYTDAFPVLQHHGFTATVFLPTAFIGDERHAFRPAGSQSNTKNSKVFPDCLTWSEVRELHRAGIEFGSHTVTHPKLVELPWSGIARELQESKRELEQRLETRVSSFCYPYAFPQTDAAFADQFRQSLIESGYQSCCTTVVGRVRRGGNLFRLKRLPVNSLDDPALFAAKLDGDYDWLGTFQSLSKFVRGGRGRPNTTIDRAAGSVGVSLN